MDRIIKTEPGLLDEPLLFPGTAVQTANGHGEKRTADSVADPGENPPAKRPHHDTGAAPLAGGTPAAERVPGGKNDSYSDSDDDSSYDDSTDCDSLVKGIVKPTRRQSTKPTHVQPQPPPTQLTHIQPPAQPTRLQPQPMQARNFPLQAIPAYISQSQPPSHQHPPNPFYFAQSQPARVGNEVPQLQDTRHTQPRPAQPQHSQPQHVQPQPGQPQLQHAQHYPEYAPPQSAQLQSVQPQSVQPQSQPVQPPSVLWAPNHAQQPPVRWHCTVDIYADSRDLVSLKTTVSGRSYRMWPEPSGKLESTLGALFPDGYSLWPDDVVNPWICPVRDCRRLFPSLTAIGGHFIKHRKTLLNDNRDGTLTAIGTYSTTILGEKGLPAVILFQFAGNSHPLQTPERFPPPWQPDEPTQAAMPPGYRKKLWEKLGASTGVSQWRPSSKYPPPSIRAYIPPVELPRLAPTAYENDDFPTPIPGNEDAMWDYIKGYLRQTTEPPTIGHVPDVICLPRKRDIRWNMFWKNGFFETFPRDVTALIMQLTGDYAPRPCRRCMSDKGPFHGCVIMASQVSNKSINSCANCWYHGYQTSCSLSTSLRVRPGFKLTAKEQREIELEAALSEQQERQREMDRNTLLALHELPVPSSSRRAAGACVSSPYDADRRSLSTGRRGILPTHPPVLTGKPHTRSSLASAAGTPTASTPANQSPGLIGDIGDATGGKKKASPFPSAPISRHQLSTQNPAEALEMENWEIGPGLVSSVVSKGDNIAFSNAYLSTNDSVAVGDGISFRVEVVRPGTRVVFDFEPRSTRICSLASGKLKVRIQGEHELSLGPNGMFKVRPCVECVVENRIYLDCVLHITSVVTEE